MEKVTHYLVKCRSLLSNRSYIVPPKVGGFWATVCKTVRPMLSDRCPVCPVLSVTLVYCGQTAEWIKMPLGTKVDVGPGHTALHGTQRLPPPQKKINKSGPQPPISACLLWPNGRPSQLLLSTCFTTPKSHI